MQQLKYYLFLLLSLPLFPILYFQGKRLRKNIVRLPEAKGIKGTIEGGKPALNLLFLGESTIASVGARLMENGMPGRAAHWLNQKTGQTINWHVTAKSGYTAKRVEHKLLAHIPEGEFDYCVVGLGGNNTFALSSPNRWETDMQSLMIALSLKMPDTELVLCNMPPVGQFPAFTKLMQLIPGNIVKMYEPANRRLAQQFDKVHYIDQPIRLEDWIGKTESATSAWDFFCADGVHPSELTYDLWGKEVAEFMKMQFFTK